MTVMTFTGPGLAATAAVLNLAGRGRFRVPTILCSVKHGNDRDFLRITVTEYLFLVSGGFGRRFPGPQRCSASNHQFGSVSVANRLFTSRQADCDNPPSRLDSFGSKPGKAPG